MDYANKLLRLSCEFVKKDEKGILALIARWEDYVDNPDGVYLRLFDLLPRLKNHGKLAK